MKAFRVKLNSFIALNLSVKFTTVFFFFCISVFGNDEIEQLIFQSFDCIEKENYACAEESLKDALRKEPANSRNGLLLANLGTVQRILGKSEDALLSYHAALSLMPDESSVLMSRAALYAEMDSVETALVDYNQVLQKNPQDELALYAAGLIYLQENDTLSAKNYFGKILAVNSNSPNGKVGYGMIYRKERNFHAADVLFSEVIQSHPENYFAYMQRAVLYFETNKNAKALEDINVYLFHFPDDEYAYFLRGQIKLQLWEKKSAYDDFQQAKLLGYDEKQVNQLIERIK